MKIRCSVCSKFKEYTEFALVTDVRIDPVCKACAKRRLNKCSKCGNYYVERCTCKLKAQQRIPPDRGSWNKRKLPVFYGKKPYVGIELEIEYNQENNKKIESVVRKRDWLSVKWDGSLMSGTEVVTEPISADELLYGKWRKRMTELLRDLKNNGAFSENSHSSGLHFHVSRDAFRMSTIVKINAFIRDNWKEITEFARRDEENITRWANAIYNNVGLVLGQHNRHSAINNKNTFTVEFRIFKGTLNPFIFNVDLQFIFALIEWVDSMPASKKRNYYKFADFKRYVLNSKTEMKELYIYVRDYC